MLTSLTAPAWLRPKYSDSSDPLLFSKTLEKLTSTLLFSLSLLGLSTAADPPAGVFTYTDTDNDAYVFALNVDSSSNDYWLHLSATSTSALPQWVAVGFGDKMAGSFMLIVYTSSNGTGVTLSPRRATEHSEPSYEKDIKCDLVADNNDLKGGNVVTRNGSASTTMSVNAVCHNLTQYASNGPFPLLQNQPMIYAVGPSSYHGPGLRSNDPAAGLARHTAYGHFSIDMTKAVSKDSSTAGVPLPNDGDNWALAGASADGQPQADHDPAPRIHGFIMSLCFVIIFPVGALVLRALKRVILHAVVQAIGLFLVCCATAGGIVVSMQYNRSKNFASAHQIIGILLLLALFAQLGLGIVHHRLYKKTQQPTKMGKIHLYMGPAILILGIINAPIGFVFAGEGRLSLPFVLVLLLMAIVYITVRFGAKLCGRGRKRQVAPVGGAEGYQQPNFGSSGPYMQAPPAYMRAPSPSPGEDVPLRPYQSQHSGIEAPPAYARPMV
ncbi:hypothetical protein LTR17_009177 [Elasticomyces elasticus]|nr:hypothetical protein LTR22_000032 [Elasticomyces elasticus]KAK5734050.1 hypothetical protein LTR17_009177 [Elasticomyces elasticus]